MKIKSEFKTKTAALKYLTNRGWQLLIDGPGCVAELKHPFMPRRVDRIVQMRSEKWMIVASQS